MEWTELELWIVQREEVYRQIKQLETQLAHHDLIAATWIDRDRKLVMQRLGDLFSTYEELEAKINAQEEEKYVRHPIPFVENTVQKLREL